MSDPDRGAYTPHNDAPLSFDARQPRGGGRKAFPTTLVISLLILVGLGVAIFLFYRQGVRGADEAPMPVGSPVGEIKAAPGAQAQQPADPATGLQIYKAEANGEAAAVSSAPQFAPPPEQPKPRPVPTTPVAAAPLAPQAAPAPAAKPVAAAAPAPAPTPVPPAAAPPTPAKPAAKSKDDVAALLDAKPAPAKKAEAPAKTEAAPAKPRAEAAPAPANVAHGAAVVQFGAFSSAALASSEWAKLAKAYPELMSGKGKLVESVERDGKTLYRGAVSGFGSRPDAAAFCAKLKADGKACIVK
jgi:outer membrane biosynthesis protein TonB